MARVLILVEGYTEELFVKNILAPYLLPRNVFPRATIIPTSKVADGPNFKGGSVGFGKVSSLLKRLLHDRDAALITTCFDFYGLRKDFPKSERGNCFEKVAELEAWVRQQFNDARLHPYFFLHEFEAMMFVCPEELAGQTSSEKILPTPHEIKSQCSSPEEINDHPDKAPSRRIDKLIPSYKKTADGLAILEKVGLDVIRAECLHFNEWLTKLESLGDNL